MDEFADAFVGAEEEAAFTENQDDGQEQVTTSTKIPRDKSSMGGSFKARFRGVTRKSSDAGSGTEGLSLQDRLFSKLFEQVIPRDDAGEHEEIVGPVKGSGAPQKSPFSLPTMTSNFRHFNARIGLVFDFQNDLADLLSWKQPTQTWSLLCIYSFICLDPCLLAVIPLVILLIFVMVPAFLARHPAPPTTHTSSTTPYYSYEGPALAPPKTIKPVPETSKDFFRNMQDLQNSMSDFTNLHDAVASTISPIANFSNEVLSSTVFLLLTVLTAMLFLTAHFLPWRHILMFGGNAAIIAGHPSVQPLLQNATQNAITNGTQTDDTKSESVMLLGYSMPTSLTELSALLISLAGISPDPMPEEREVEIFELQHKVWSPYSTTPEWEPFIFTPTPYDPLSPSRITGDRPRGARFFEDVRPPAGWAWKGKKWQLDLDCAEWVMERMVTGVELEVAGGNGSSSDEVGGWVWDLPFQSGEEEQEQENEQEDEHEEEEGDETQSAIAGLSTSDLVDGATRYWKSKPGPSGSSAHADWEESTKATDRTGEWRRRRWVRIVHRVSVEES